MMKTKKNILPFVQQLNTPSLLSIPHLQNSTTLSSSVLDNGRSLDSLSAEISVQNVSGGQKHDFDVSNNKLAEGVDSYSNDFIPSRIRIMRNGL